MKKIENVKTIGEKQSKIVINFNVMEAHVHQQISPHNKVIDESGLLTNKFD